MSRRKKQVATEPQRRSLSPRKKLFFSFFVLLSVFAFLEFGLRLARIGEPPEDGLLRFGYDTGIPIFDSDGIEREGEPFQDFPLFEADAELFWKPIENTPFTGPNGLRLATPATKQKDSGVLRIGVLGDSCSFLGVGLYPNRLAEALREDLGCEVEVVNASCPGYTSMQGVRRLQDVWSWDPDVLLVYFGWNDHWKSLNGQTDRDVMQRQKLGAKASSWLGVSRLFWCLYTLRTQLVPPVSMDVAPVRVPPQDYSQNLQEIVRAAEQRDCPVILITAPSAFLPGNVPRWAYDFFGQIYWMSPQEVARIPETHDEYNDVVRAVTQSSPSAFLMDIADQWSSPAMIEKHPELFRADRIHLTEAGHQEISDQLRDLWREQIQNRDADTTTTTESP